MTLGWRGDDERAGFLQVEIAHRVDYVGVRCRHPRARVHPVLPDWQDVVAFTECRLRTVAHTDHVQRRKHGYVGMDRALIVEFVAQRLRFLLRKPVAVADLRHKRWCGLILRIDRGGDDRRRTKHCSDDQVRTFSGHDFNLGRLRKTPLGRINQRLVRARTVWQLDHGAMRQLVRIARGRVAAEKSASVDASRL